MGWVERTPPRIVCSNGVNPQAAETRCTEICCPSTAALLPPSQEHEKLMTKVNGTVAFALLHVEYFLLVLVFGGDLAGRLTMSEWSSESVQRTSCWLWGKLWSTVVPHLLVESASSS